MYTPRSIEYVVVIMTVILRNRFFKTAVNGHGHSKIILSCIVMTEEGGLKSRSEKTVGAIYSDYLHVHYSKSRSCYFAKRDNCTSYTCINV